MKKQQIIGLTIIAVIALYFGVRIIRNALTSEETKIKKFINTLAKNFEDKKFKNIFKYVTEDYTDEGRNTKESLQKDSRYIIAFAQKINLSLSDMRVVISPDGERAEAGFNVSLRMTVGDSTFEPLGGSYPAKLYLRKDNGNWMIYRSNLRSYGLDF